MLRQQRVGAREMVPKPTSRSRALDITLELGIAIGIVALLLVVAFFYETYENAKWMPSPDSLTQGAWIFVAAGLGVAYSYLAYSTRRLQRSMADKNYMQPLMALMDKWYMDAAIAAVCFIVAVALLWRMLAEQRNFNASAMLQVLMGAIIVLGGVGVLRLRARLRSHSGRTEKLSQPFTTYVLAAAVIVYGAVRIISGIYLFVK
jgi:hypothetical protein